MNTVNPDPPVYNILYSNPYLYDSYTLNTDSLKVYMKSINEEYFEIKYITVFNEKTLSNSFEIKEDYIFIREETNDHLNSRYYRFEFTEIHDRGKSSEILYDELIHI